MAKYKIHKAIGERIENPEKYLEKCKRDAETLSIRLNNIRPFLSINLDIENQIWRSSVDLKDVFDFKINLQVLQKNLNQVLNEIDNGLFPPGLVKRKVKIVK